MTIFLLESFLTRLMVFNRHAIGNGARRQEILAKATSQIAAIRQAGGEPSTWAELVLLAMDGLSRSIWAENPTWRADDVADAAAQMIAGCQASKELIDNWRPNPE